MRARTELRIPLTAPLFCTISKPSAASRIYAAEIRKLLRDHAAVVGIDKRMTAERLRRSAIAHRSRPAGTLEAHIGIYLDDEPFRTRHPDAHKQLQSALDVFSVDPTRQAARIAHDCNEALGLFAESVDPGGRRSPKTKIRNALAREYPTSHETALASWAASYWQTLSDLARRQEHTARHHGTPLGTAHARRLIFHTAVVMFELDRLLTAP